MTYKETSELIRQFKTLVEMDVSGITSSDARRTVSRWLLNIGQPAHAKRFEERILAYQDSPKIRKMEEE